jgi:predicted CXXCH cytochrome family protein
MQPSPRSHVYRLLLVMGIGLVGFVFLKGYLVPESWDYEAWYRTDALPLLAQQASVYGGNESCHTAGCHSQPEKDHEEKHGLLKEATHDGLACEGCHGPLGAHASAGKKVAGATVVEDSSLCLRCHDALLGRARKVTAFDPMSKRHKPKKVTRETDCVKCHDPHSPKEKADEPTQADASESAQDAADQPAQGGKADPGQSGPGQS